MRTFIAALTCLICLAAGRAPNIVHIVGDDVGYDDLSCYGAPKIKTPNLDKLAAAGVRFTSFYAPSPVCTPTRASYLTGCYAQRVGLQRVLFPNDDFGLAASEVTIAELLKGRGYATALIGKWHLGCRKEFLPHHHGFDLYYGIPYPNDHGPERANSNKQTKPFPPIPVYRNDDVVEQPADLANLPDKMVDEAVRFITANKDQPFFLHFANVETHTPWFVPKRFEGKSADGAYGDAVECMDANVGRIMEALERLGLADNTLVMFTSDNGPLWKRAAELEAIYGRFGTVDLTRPHLLRGGKYQARLEGGTRVPMIARWPGQIPAGRTCQELAAGFDLFATFAAAGGAEVPKDRIIDGKDVTPLLRGDANAKSPHEAFYYYQGYELVAVRSGNWKLDFVEHALFDVQNDPGEKVNRAAEEAEVVAKLEKLAEQARGDLGDTRTGQTGKNIRPHATASAGQ